MSAPPPRAVTERRARTRIVDAAVIVVLLAISMIPLWPIYEHSAVLWLGGVGLAVATSVAIAGARWPTYAVVALTVVAYGLIGVPLAVPTRAYAGVLPSPLGLRTLATGTVTSWREMLTAQVPLGAYETLLVPALIVVLTASVVGVSLALRARRPGWAVLAPLAVLAFGILFGSTEALWPTATGIALVLVALTWATVRSDATREAAGFAGARRRPTVPTIRRYATAVLLIVVCGAGASALTKVWAADTRRDVLRADVIPPQFRRDLISPLIGYRNTMLAPGSEKSLLTARGLPDGVRIRLAVLDAYNGQVFAVGTHESSGTFERVPYRIDRDGGGSTTPVTLTIEGLTGPWLPTVGDLTAIHFTADPRLVDRFYYNATGSDAALVGGLKPTTYTVDAAVEPLPELESLASATPGPADQPELKAIPQEIVDAAHQHGTGGRPGERLVVLANWLRSGYVSHSDRNANEPFSRPGHSAERLRLLVTGDPMIGDAEQYATAMALLAREIGFPARVVVGYAPGPDQTEIRGADTTAWVEVQVADGTWVGLDPNPIPREIPATGAPTVDPASKPESVPPPPPQTNDDPITPQNDDGDTNDDHPGPHGGGLDVLLTVLRGVGIASGAVAVLTLPVWALAVAAWVRRLRRRRRDRRRAAVTGAWNEVRDAMVDRGYDLHPAATRREAAALADTPEIHALADRADRGVFDVVGFTTDDVAGYWSQVRAARRSLDAGATRSMRFRRVVTLKSARSLGRSWASWRRARGKGMS